MEQKGNSSNKSKPQSQPKANPLLSPTWKQRTAETHPQHLQKLKESPDAEVLLIGSSMIERFLTSGKMQLSKLEQFKYVLAGVGGDGIQHMLYRLDQGLIEACPTTLHTVVLMAGTNNIEKSSVDNVFEGTVNLIKEIQKRRENLKIYLLSMLPRDSTVKNLSNESLAEKVVQVNKKFEELQMENVIYHSFYDLCLWNGKKNGDLYDDHVHLNSKGYSIFAGELIKLLEKK